MGLICGLLGLFLLVLFARMILSWFPITPGSTMATVDGILRMLTDPVLIPLRRRIPPARVGMAAIDLSSLIVVFGIIILRGILCN